MNRLNGHSHNGATQNNIERTAYLIGIDSTAQARIEEACRFCQIVPVVVESLESFRRQLDADRIKHPSCVISSFNLADGDGFELTRCNGSLRTLITLVFACEDDEVAMAVEAMRQGAFSILSPPWDPSVVSRELNAALSFDKACHQRAMRLRSVEEAWLSLTFRETEVLKLLLNGSLNKSIARKLDVSVRTIEGDRARILSKFGVENAIELAKLTAELQILFRATGMSAVQNTRFDPLSRLSWDV